MRVCFVSFEYPPNSLVMGGAGTYAGFLVKELESRGVDVHTITTGNKSAREQKIYRISVPNMIYWRRLFFANAAVDLLRGLNRKHKFDLVHFNEPHIITVSPNLPTVCTFHSTQLHELRLNLKERSLKNVESIVDLVIKNPVGYLCDILTGRMCNKIICPTSDLARLLKYCFVYERKIHVIPNGIDLKVFDETNCDGAFLEGKPFEKESFVLYMGRLTSRKGVHHLIKAFQNVKKECSELKLVIAGSGDFEPYLRKMALGTKDIFFTGFINSIMKKKLLYENSLAVVVPSIYETFPMVVLEAMACGKPIVASNVGGIRSMIKHGKNGFLTKPKDVGALETFIKRLYECPNLRRRMGISSRRSVEKEFTISRMGDRTLKVYESLL